MPHAIEAAGAWLMDVSSAICNLDRPGPHLPSPPCTLAEARDELRRMASDPKPLARPVLVLGAYHAWAPVSWSLVRKLRKATGAKEHEIRCVPFLFETSLHAAAIKAVRHAAAFWPPTPDGISPPLDLVGISMGGLIARIISGPERMSIGLPPDLARINAARIFTFGSPLAGARIAAHVRPDRAARDMRPDSHLIQRLGPASDATPLICYAQLRDNVVGARRAAPIGMHPIWTGGSRLFSHFTTPHNPWFLVDIARRLRGEPPLFNAATTCPPRD